MVADMVTSLFNAAGVFETGRVHQSATQDNPLLIDIGPVLRRLPWGSKYEFLCGRCLMEGWKRLARLVMVVVMWSLCQSAVAGAETVPAAVERQHIAVTLEPERHLVAGESVITYAAGTKAALLRLSQGATVTSVAVAGRSIPFSFQRGVLSLNVPPGTAAPAVTVSWRAAFNDPVSQHPAASEDPSYGVRGAVTREGTFLGGEAYWYPVPQQVPARRSIGISAPAGIEAITNGKLVSRESTAVVTRSLWEEARPVGLLSLCAGPYRIEHRRLGAIDLYSYLFPGNAALSARYLDATAKYLALYQELFGPYPFEKYAVVENFFPTGYGFPSFTLLGGSVIRLPFIPDTSLPHEIAHSWWGNGIEPELAEGNWSEGLVTYLADYLLKERRSQAEGIEYRRQLLIDYASLVSAGSDFPLSSFTGRSDPASRSIGYGKGAMLFHMIRREIGDAPFFEALRQLCRTHMYGSATWSDFTAAFSRSSGKEFGPSVKQWLTRSGGPRLSLAGVTTRREGKGWTVTGDIAQDPAPFRLAVPLRLESEGGETKEVVSVAGEHTRFSLSSPTLPKRLLLDPDAEVFRVLSPGEIPATVNSIKGSDKVIGVVTENCKAAAGTFKALLASLSQESAPLIDEGRLDPGAAGSSDLVFCGVPKNRSLLPRLPDGVRLEADGFKLDGSSFAGPDGLLLLVLARPQAPGKVAALFLPLSESAASQYAPKITHYGKYGFLAFAGGSNRRKGTAAAADRKVSVDLTQQAP